jgi:hypothetical protein
MKILPSNCGSRRPNRSRTCTPALAHTSYFDTDRTRSARTPTSPRSIGFCATWDCASSSFFVRVLKSESSQVKSYPTRRLDYRGSSRACSAKRAQEPPSWTNLPKSQAALLALSSFGLSAFSSSRRPVLSRDDDDSIDDGNRQIAPAVRSLSPLPTSEARPKPPS